MLDRKLYRETFAQVRASEETLSEVLKMTKQTKRCGGIRVTRILVAAVIMTAMLATTAFAYVGFTQYENPMELLRSFFGDSSHVTYKGAVVEETYFDYTYTRVEPTVERVPLDEELAGSVAPYIADINKAATYNEYTLTVLAHQFDSVTNSGTIYYTLENPNGISYDVFYDGSIKWAGGNLVKISHAHSADFLIVEDTTDTKLAVACYYIRTGEDTENYIGVEMTEYILSPSGNIAADEMKAFEERNQTIKLALDDGGGMKGLTLAEGRIRLSPVAIWMETGAMEFLKETGYVGNLVIRYQDGSEYVVDAEKTMNYTYALSSGSGSELTYTFNRLVDVNAVAAVVIDDMVFTDVELVAAEERVSVAPYVEEPTQPRTERNEFDGIVRSSACGASISYQGYTLTVEDFIYDAENKAGVALMRVEHPDGIGSYDLERLDRITLGDEQTIEISQYGSWVLDESRTTDKVLVLKLHFIRLNDESDSLKLYFGGGGADVLIDSATEDMLYFELKEMGLTTCTLGDGAIRLSAIGMSVAYERLREKTGNVQENILLQTIIRYSDGREYLIADITEESYVLNAMALDTKALRGSTESEGMIRFSLFETVDLDAVESVIYNGVEYLLD